MAAGAAAVVMAGAMVALPAVAAVLPSGTDLPVGMVTLPVGTSSSGVDTGGASETGCAGIPSSIDEVSAVLYDQVCRTIATVAISLPDLAEAQIRATCEANSVVWRQKMRFMRETQTHTQSIRHQGCDSTW